MGSLATNFYKSLFSSEGVSDMERVLQNVPIKVTPEMNDMLLTPFDSKEVKEVLFQMFPTKAPGPDGFRRTSSSATGNCVGKNLLRWCYEFYEVKMMWQALTRSCWF